MAAENAGPSGDANPLLEALPPATDYLTYLTVIEYNLTPESLPTLHNVLQDAKLTTNIGWDLVHLLLPFLPASQECLQDIARLGNPREVILKVTECLRLIDFAGLSSDSDEELTSDHSDSHTHAHSHATAPVHTGHTHDHESTQAVEVIPTPLPVDQFISLLSMLSILHGRIKTQHPSRFLSTSLQAVLHAFSNSTSHREELVSSVVRFVKDVGGVKRPHLPSRVSSSSSTLLLSTPTAAHPDPEPDAGSDDHSVDERDMQRKLVQSFLTYIVGEYMLALSSRHDAPGLAWATRLQEKLHPERVIPGKTSFTKKFESQPVLHARLTAVGQLLAISRDLGLKTEDMLDAALATEHVPSTMSHEESDPPKSAAEVPLAKIGSLLLYTASTVGNALFSRETATSSISIFPTHRHLLSEFVSSPASGASMIGTEPEAVLDALLALAVQAIEADNFGQPDDSEQFNNYLQIVSLISSNCPSPSLRYMAYYITTTILRSNPSDIERLAFIRDTLEHCPFDNLKVAAISWIKGETIEACGPESHPSSSSAPSTSAAATAKDDTSIFATPVALDTLSPYLFPDLTSQLSQSSINDAYDFLDENLQFYLASLNFYFLLLSAESLRQNLAIKTLHENHDIDTCFLRALVDITKRAKESSGIDGALGKTWAEKGDTDVEQGKLKLIEATLEKVSDAVAQLYSM